MIVILLSGPATNVIWCVILDIKNKSYTDYINTKTSLVKNYFISAFAGANRYLQFLFYGIGSSKLGKYDFTSRTFHMAFTIIVSNLWGLYLKEWQGSSKKTLRLIFAGISVAILSTVIAGLANYLEVVKQE